MTAFNESADHLVRDLQKRADSKKTFPLHPLLTEVTLDVIMRVSHMCLKSDNRNFWISQRLLCLSDALQRIALPEHTHWSFLLDPTSHSNAFGTRRLGNDCAIARKLRWRAVEFVRTDKRVDLSLFKSLLTRIFMLKWFQSQFVCSLCPSDAHAWAIMKG